MSNSAKRRLVITAVLAGQSQSEVARTYGASQSWISRLMTRYRSEGQAAFEPASRRPASNPNATAPGTVELIVQLRRVGFKHGRHLDTVLMQRDLSDLAAAPAGAAIESGGPS